MRCVIYDMTGLGQVGQAVGAALKQEGTATAEKLGVLVKPGYETNLCYFVELPGYQRTDAGTPWRAVNLVHVYGMLFANSAGATGGSEVRDLVYMWRSVM